MQFFFRKQVCIALLLFSLQTFADTKIKGNCTVSGHGPYDETRDGCVELGKKQVVTLCILSSQDTNVQLLFEGRSKSEKWTCHAQYLKKKNDCRYLNCTPN